MVKTILAKVRVDKKHKLMQRKAKMSDEKNSRFQRGHSVIP